MSVSGFLGSCDTYLRGSIRESREAARCQSLLKQRLMDCSRYLSRSQHRILSDVSTRNITKGCPATRLNLETHPFWRIYLSADYKDARQLCLGTYTPNGGIKMEMKYSKTSLFAVCISDNIPSEAEHPQLTRRRLGHV